MRNSEIQSIKQRFGIVGNSDLLNNAIERAIQVAPTDMSVLITGESGTGKESFSKIIHNLSPRKHGQFIAINCGGIPEGTIYSELFGHEKGAFTGSTDARKGYFEVTDGGTIFLDEIGEMPLDTQAMLLRVLENGEFIRMGSSKALKTNVRVVAATNVNLLQAVEQKKFREDLYYRLSTVPIYVPPLRERGDDVDLLFRKFALDFAEKYRVTPIKLSPEAKQMLSRFRFRGNIRQLKNLVEQISLLEADNPEIDSDTLRSYLPEEERQQALTFYQKQAGTNSEAQDFSEREILYKVLFDMRKDVGELKKLVFQLIQNGNFSSDFLQDHKELFQDVNEPAATVPENYEQGRASLLLASKNTEPSELPKLILKGEEKETIEEDKATTHDVEHEEEEDTLSIEQKEKELIIKALRKNKNKRKYAAQDLGISERTLYRKIKQYEIENQ